jgi:hypothetical protein
MKAHDMYVAALCPECHYALDQGKDLAEVGERRTLAAGMAQNNIRAI